MTAKVEAINFEQSDKPVRYSSKIDNKQHFKNFFERVFGELFYGGSNANAAVANGATGQNLNTTC